MNDLFEHEHRGTGYRVRLECGHEYRFYKHNIIGTDLLESPAPLANEPRFYPNGVLHKLPQAYRGFQYIADGAILPAGSGIFCPATKNPHCLKFRMMTHQWVDVDWIERNPYYKYIPFGYGG